MSAHETEDTVSACAYCGRDVYAKDAQVPPEGIRATQVWRRLAKKHGSHCEWIATRGHNLAIPTDEQIAGLRVAARAAGDEQQVALCDCAHDGIAYAIALCASALR